MIPGSGRSPGEGNGNPLQYSCLENPMEGGAWWAAVHGVTKSWTRLSDVTSRDMAPVPCSLHIMWPKYWSFSFSISPSNEYSGLTSFRMDWLDLLAVQGTLKSLLQHHSSKASFLWRSAFFIVQLSHPYVTTGKTIDLTRRAFVREAMSLLFSLGLS